MSEPTTDDIELGPIDYLVVEFPGANLTGRALPHLIDLVDRGIIRLLDVGFILKEESGGHHNVTADELNALNAPELEVFAGAQSGLLDEDDLDQVAAIIAPGSAAGILVYENTWAAPFATALRGAGAQVVSNGRIPIQSLLAALDADSSETD